MKDEEMKCANCFYYVETANTNRTYGQCHRYPPASGNVTTPEYWCGEWKPKPEVKTDG